MAESPSADRSCVLARMVDVVRAAAVVCTAVQRDLRAGESYEKSDLSPVTVADLAVQAWVGRALLPDVPLVGEETSEPLRADPALADAVLGRLSAIWPGATEREVFDAIDRGNAAGGRDGRFFVLDPIDGTKGFLRGDQYAIALALVEDGRPTLGVLGCPNLPGAFREDDDERPGVLVAAAEGGGARALPIATPSASAGRSVEVSDRADPTAARMCESVESAHTSHGVSSTLREQVGIVADPVRVDSQAKYALIALGAAEVYVRIPRDPNRSETIWDHAAGAVVVAAAGGRVTDLDGRPLDFGCGRRLAENRGILATNGRVHDALLAATTLA